ncbi:glycosyltransferase [Notoacmeibacter ruber]|uniref:Glycosyltransferase n=1 Tax=Notoacmeibacter ruber TaxID=2670375 RepID=A0A3L7JDC0_9HYPH|nr:glycosyltransferase [Notoacmeibacter ruber]RLQ88305.1 glycosyltransferase [Notoacmeibacter ruber]
MKVFHFHFGKDGGAERFFTHLVAALGERGVEQTAVIRPKRLWRPAIAPYATIIESHFRDLSTDRLLLPLRMKRRVSKERPDAVLAWMPKGAKLMPADPKTHKIARLGDYPLRLKHFDRLDTLVCNTPGIAERVRELGWTRNVEVITNFTNEERVAPVDRAAYGAGPDDFVVSTMGRFVPRKGFDVLIDAAALNPSIHLWIMGDGELAEALAEQAKERGVENRVKFLGWQSDIRPFVAASDAFAMASNHEPLGNVVLEAWAQGKPVVSTRCEGPSWFMEDGADGLMVDIGDAEGFAKAFARLKEEDGLAERLAAGGMATLKSRFSKQAICDQYIRLFKEKP